MLVTQLIMREMYEVSMVKQKEGMGMNWVLNRSIKNRVAMSTNEMIKDLSRNLDSIQSIHLSISMAYANSHIIFRKGLHSKLNFLVISDTLFYLFQPHLCFFKDFAPSYLSILKLLRETV